MNQSDEVPQNRVFRLSYSHELPDSDGDQESFHIGIYSSRRTAEQALAELLKQPGFRDDPEGFVIDEEVIDETNWQEGFVTEFL